MISCLNCQNFYFTHNWKPIKQMDGSGSLYFVIRNICFLDRQFLEIFVWLTANVDPGIQGFSTVVTLPKKQSQWNQNNANTLKPLESRIENQ